MEHNSVCLLRKLRKIVKKKKNNFHKSFTIFWGYFGHFVGFEVILVSFRF